MRPALCAGEQQKREAGLWFRQWTKAEPSAGPRRLRALGEVGVVPYCCRKLDSAGHCVQCEGGMLRAVQRASFQAAANRRSPQRLLPLSSSFKNQKSIEIGKSGNITEFRFVKELYVSTPSGFKKFHTTFPFQNHQNDAVLFFLNLQLPKELPPPPAAAARHVKFDINTART